jgi:hypothetical protein
MLLETRSEFTERHDRADYPEDYCNSE